MSCTGAVRAKHRRYCLARSVASAIPTAFSARPHNWSRPVVAVTRRSLMRAAINPLSDVSTTTRQVFTRRGSYVVTAGYPATLVTVLLLGVEFVNHLDAVDELLTATMYTPHAATELLHCVPPNTGSGPGGGG